MASILGAIFGSPEAPAAQEQEEKTKVDPNRDAELAQAARRKREIFGRRGRSALKTSGGRTRGGVTFGASGAKSAPKPGGKA